MIQANCLAIGAVFEDNCQHRFVLKEFSVDYIQGGDGASHPIGTATLETVPLDGEAPQVIIVPINGEAVLNMIDNPDLLPP